MPVAPFEAHDRNRPQGSIDRHVRQRIQPRTEKEDISQRIRRFHVGDGIDDRRGGAQPGSLDLVREIARVGMIVLRLISPADPHEPHRTFRAEPCHRGRAREKQIDSLPEVHRAAPEHDQRVFAGPSVDAARAARRQWRPFPELPQRGEPDMSPAGAREPCGLEAWDVLSEPRRRRSLQGTRPGSTSRAPGPCSRPDGYTTRTRAPARRPGRERGPAQAAPSAFRCCSRLRRARDRTRTDVSPDASLPPRTTRCEGSVRPRQRSSSRTPGTVRRRRAARRRRCISAATAVRCGTR